MQRFLHVQEPSCYPHLPKYLIQKKCCSGRERQSRPKPGMVGSWNIFGSSVMRRFTDLPAITLVTCGFLFSHIHLSLFFLGLLSAHISHSKPNFSLTTVFCHDVFPSLSFCFPQVASSFSAAMPLISLFPLDQIEGQES